MSDAQMINVMKALPIRHLILSAALAVGMGATAEAALFDAPVNLPGTTLGEAVATADFDNDGWMDAVVATSSNTADILYRNNHDGTFTRIVLPGTSTGFGVKCADLNADGRVDIAVATSSSAPDLIYQNDGNLTFTRVNAGTINTASTAIDIADLNNDGKPDLVVATASSSPASDLVYYNMGNMTFAREPLPGTTLADAVVVADIDGDGDLDIAVGTRAGGATSGYVYRNDGGTFSLGSRYATGYANAVNGMAAGQLNGTGGLEIFAATSDGTRDFLVSYTGAPAAPFQFGALNTASGSAVRDGVALLDLDLDGDTDAFMAVRSGSDFAYLNAPSGGQANFTKVTFPSSTVTKRGVALADFDNDGDLDAVVATGNGISADMVYYNTTLTVGMDTDGDTIPNAQDQDDDNDGMPDIFEVVFGLNPLVNDANNNADNDGLTNYQEFILGTLPNAGPSYGISLLPGPTGSNSLVFTAKAATGAGYTGMTRRFTVECAVDIEQGIWEPVTGFVNIVGQGQSVSVPLNPAGNPSSTFYRLKIEVSL